MSMQHRISLWLGLILSVSAALYFATAVVFYTWMNASSPGRWPADKAGLWIGGSFAFFLLSLAVFGYCGYAIIRDWRRHSRARDRQSGK